MEGTPWSSNTSERALVAFVCAAAIGALLAGAVLWLGGAAEVVLHDSYPEGPECRFGSSEVGDEQSDWVGGGLMWRPGQVCVLGGFAQKQLTWFDFGSAGLAVLVFAYATVFLTLRWARRGGPRSG